MSIPTQVFENGRWVTRFADIHHVVAQNRDQETVEVKKAIETPKPPMLGLLTQTLVRSPVVKWIIPARIRHHSKNDVLYITTDSVEIKEACGDYTLQHVAIKDDFDSPIKAVRICGLQREITKPDVNAIIRKEEHWRDDVHHHNMEDVDQPLDENTDTLMKSELDDITESAESDFDDADMQSVQAVPLHTRTLSPHILILILDSGKLVFMYTVNGDATIPHLVTSQRSLWKGQRPLLDQIGRHLAVDPKSRAIAVAAQENIFYVYTLRPMSALQSEVRKRPQIQPIVSEHAFEVDGTILKMEFLYAPEDGPDQVILLLIIHKNGKSRLVWYEWNSASPLAQTHMKPVSQILPVDERIPLLLIPTRAFTAFILVCESRITLYRDLLTGTPSRHVHKLNEVLEPEEMGSSKRKPLWVQWARVLRSKTHSAQGDGVYLCREDGIVHFLEIKYGHHSLIDSTHQVGKLGTNIDSCFAVIDVGPHASDLLAAGGDSSEGGLWRFDAREPPKKIWKDPSWTPVVDCCTALVRKTSNMTDAPLGQRQIYEPRIFACVGKAKHGALSEFRYGFPATRTLSIPLKDLLENGILAVWVLRNIQEVTSYLVLSHPKQTYLLRFRLDGGEDNSVAELVENTRALELNGRTIAIKSLDGVRVVQITETAAWVCSFGAMDDDNTEEVSRHVFDGARVLAACLGVPGSESLTVVALVHQGKFYLQLAEVIDGYKVLGDTLEIEHQPTAVALASVIDGILVVVGFVHGPIDVYNVKRGTQEWTSMGPLDYRGDNEVCESIAVATPVVKANGEYSVKIACGMRNGLLHVISAGTDKHGFQVIPHKCPLPFGDTSVTVVAALSDPDRFILQSGDQILSLEYCFPEHDSGFENVHYIWFTDDEKPGWQPGRISAMTIVQNIQTTPTSTGVFEMVCIDREFIHVAQLDYAGGPRNVPRRLPVGGTPTRAIYSEYLRKIIVLTHRTSVIRHSRTGGGRTYPGKRTLRPVIIFLDPNSTYNESLEDDEMDIDPDHASHKMRNERITSSSLDNYEAPSYEPGERFLGIAEWLPKIGDKKSHMLIVHTMMKADDTHVARSRLLLFSFRVIGDTISLILKKDTPPSMPIYAVAVHPNGSSIVYHTGDELRILRLETTDTGLKWSAPIKAQLRSPARHITITVPYIYVSTAGNSLAVYRETGDFLEFVANDTVARQGLHHITPVGHGLTVMTDMGSSITGLWKAPNPSRIDHSLTTIFEASLAHAVIRLQLVRRAPWHGSRGEKEDSEEEELVTRDLLYGLRFYIGIATTGAITRHRLVTPDQWPFLRFLQNLAERSRIVCPFTDGTNNRHLDPARSTKPDTRAINADILTRLFSKGPELMLRLMNRPPTPEERHLDFDSVKDRWERFKELYGKFRQLQNVTLLDDLDVEAELVASVLNLMSLWLTHQI